MRRFVLIQLLGLVAFVLLAMAQEWKTFATAWLGSAPSALELGDEERRAAADTVHEYLTLLAHVHARGGDARFLDRLPASEQVIDELVEDIRYLERNRRRQVMTLQRVEIQAVEQLGERRVEVRTREWWTIAYLRSVSGEPAGKAGANVIEGRFLVVRETAGWRVDGVEALDLRWSRADEWPGPDAG